MFLGVSAEVVSSYSLALQQLYPNKTIIPVGCVWTVFGYWPLQNIMSQEGYEAHGFKKGFLFKGRFIKSQIEHSFFKCVEKVLSQ